MDNLPEGIPSKEKEIAAFIGEITKADGRLLPLPGKESRLNEPFFISARYGQDKNVPDEYTYAIVDVFVERDGKYLPVGIKDYEIEGTVASGNKQRHQHVECHNKAQEAADRFWNTGEGFHVVDTTFLNYGLEKGHDGMHFLREQKFVKSEEDWKEPIYQKLGLGQLMIAVSTLVLQKQGIETIAFGSWTESAQKAWKHFGIESETSISVEQLASHPNIQKSIEPFV